VPECSKHLLCLFEFSPSALSNGLSFDGLFLDDHRVMGPDNGAGILKFLLRDYAFADDSQPESSGGSPCAHDIQPTFFGDCFYADELQLQIIGDDVVDDTSKLQRQSSDFAFADDAQPEMVVGLPQSSSIYGGAAGVAAVYIHSCGCFNDWFSGEMYYWYLLVI
jgi:hypothetical protein